MTPEELTPPTENNAALLAWAVGILLAFIIAGIVFYEKKNSKIQDRLNNVIDDNIARMEKRHENEQAGMTKINDMLIKLKELFVLFENKTK
ncbi:MAG: Unknown protein [uncultured Sulfurovum sp.]|uniref:Uncharacterized protein n=1 Tax=uncultured Sulfurovum sp. TaxID=269237 RepID=A0A6S6SPY9_9BACT|nr:MAG: Unknown protein [uncultured Sulfurovum sp.]